MLGRDFVRCSCEVSRRLWLWEDVCDDEWEQNEWEIENDSMRESESNREFVLTLVPIITEEIVCESKFVCVK